MKPKNLKKKITRSWNQSLYWYSLIELSWDKSRSWIFCWNWPSSWSKSWYVTIRWSK